MKCPYCNNENTNVKDSRPAEENSTIRRRRACVSCGGRFTTFERVQLRELIVEKSHGRHEVFDREKLKHSLQLALRKRPVDDEEIEKMVNSIRRRLEVTGDKEITSQHIGSLAIDTLAVTDIIGYIRYASVYKDFDQLEEFKDFLETLERLGRDSETPSLFE